MQRGRKYPQLLHRWASPDFGVRNYPPITLLLRPYVIAASGSTYNPDIETADVAFDASTGVWTYTIPPTMFGPYELTGTWTQNWVQPPGQRLISIDLSGPSGTAGGSRGDVDGPFIGYHSGPIPIFPIELFRLYGTGVWLGVQFTGFAGKPYF